MAVSDADGTIYYRYIYDTYGELSDITTDDGVSLKSSEQLTEYRLAELADATDIDYLYNGQYGVETDQNGLYYMRARYYDQDIKRFINRDIVSGDISSSQSLNRYCYVQGNPVSLTDPFGLCPDPNSNFKNFCKFLYEADWSAIGHAALDVAGIFWEGADVINAVWYALEGNTEMAIASAIFAIPGLGIGVGNLMMKSEKLAGAGKAVKAISKMTQSGMGIAAGINMAQIGFTNMLNSIEAGEFSTGDLAMMIGGIAISVISGKGLVSSGKDLMACSDDLAKMWKNTKSRASENFRKFMNDNGGFLDLDAFKIGLTKSRGKARAFSDLPWYEQVRSTSGTGRARNNIGPNKNATGRHVVYKVDPQTGKITNYKVYDVNSQNPSGFDEVLGYDGVGKSHKNPVTGENLIPHVHDKTVPGKVRAPYPDEVPD